MKLAAFMVGMTFIGLSSAASASGEKGAVRAVIKAIKRGEDLNMSFPGATSERARLSLQGVAKCAALNLMKQPGGHYTVVWDCGSKGALGMEVEVNDKKVTSISTMEVERR